MSAFGGIYEGKSVLVTGHTGFKGSWLCAWLESLGAKVTGYALEPPTTPNHIDHLALSADSRIADIRDEGAFMDVVNDTSPEIIFHLAAQPSVLVSYQDPLYTFSTNVIGTANVLEAARKAPSVKAVVIITTDKCYENKEVDYAYKEDDILGGHDPYSSSKACAELVSASFRKSFSNEPGMPLIATARAGNVLGGGDWTDDRLVPDAVRAAAAGSAMGIRNPNSSRPWQHVLEPLSGYLLLGKSLLEGKTNNAEAWNFGPKEASNVTTAKIIQLSKQLWTDIRCEVTPVEDAPHEAGLLMVDSTKARERLGWAPIWDISKTIEHTIHWYRNFYSPEQTILTRDDIEAYCRDARESGAIWAT